MEKNTALTIGLSTAILVVFFAIQTFFFPQRRTGESQGEAATPSEVAVPAPEATTGTLSGQSVFASDSEQAQRSSVREETFVIETSVAKVTFTNRGGDVIGYELKNHNDRDTGKGVEMCANVTGTNRAFALSIGADGPVVNELFSAKVIDDKTIGFFRDFSVRKSDGSLGHFTLVKTYSFKDDEYLFTLDVTIDGGEGFDGLDIGGVAYSIRTAPQIGPAFNPKDRYDIREIIAYDGNKKFSPKAGKERDFEWIAVAGKYFEILLDPGEDVAVSGLVKIVSPDKRGAVKDSQVVVSRKGVGGRRVSDLYNIYIGPRSEKEIKKYTVAEKNDWHISGGHYDESLPTSGILSWLEYVLKFIMELIYRVIPNWGVSIIVLTVLLKIALFPLTKKSLEGTQKMSQVQPKMKEIQERYKNDPQKMQQETAKLYKEIGYNPMSGCLPLVFQFVILWSMYHLFNNYFEFRGASFIPGWINDLSSTDSVCTFPFTIPWLGNELHILPIIYLISQLLYGKITQNGGTSVGQNGGQMKMMMYGMPVLFFFLFYSAPSGLLLYWTVSNVFQLGQQLFINHKMRNAPVAVGKSKAAARPKSKR